MEDTAKVITTPDYLRILDEEKLLTFSTVVDGVESNHQISIIEYDTRDKIEARMAEVLVQVKEELAKSGNADRRKLIPVDIQQLIDDAIAQNEKDSDTIPQNGDDE